MPINGHPFSSQTLFAPSQDGHSHTRRISVTASPEPSAIRPVGLPAAHDLVQSTPAPSGASSVDGERPRGGGWQDKAVLTDGSPASSQPGPDTIVARASLSDTGSPRSHNDSAAKERLVKGAVWMRPGVKLSLQQIAKADGLSFSATAAKGLEVYARAKIHDQEETLFEPRMQAMLRREIRSSDNRHLYFEMRNAIAAEQTRILTTDLYKRQLIKEGVPLKEINKKLDNAYTMARDNILRKTKTPQLRNLLDAWWRSTDEQIDGREEQHTGAGEAGTGQPEA